ncbi:hypothetical protein D9M72_394440 [compost metagenome]
MVRGPVGCQAQPRRTGREARVRCGAPLHGCSLRVATQAHAGLVLLERVLHFIDGNGDVRHADLVAVVERRRAAQREQQHGRESRHLRPDAARNAGPVVVAQHPVRLGASGQGGFVVAHEAVDARRLPFGRDQLEVEGKLHAFEHACGVESVVGDQARERQVELADQHARRACVAECVDHAAHLGHDRLHLRQVGVVEHQPAKKRVLAFDEVGVRRVVAELRVLDDLREHVDAESVDAAPKPEAQHLVHRGAHFGVAPVEVGLLLQERMAVVLAGGRIEGPGRAAEIAEPVVGRPAVRCRVAPDVPVASRIAACAATLHEPRMTVRRVVGHEVQDELEPSRVGLLHQRIEAVQRAEARIDVAKIGDVVAEVGHRRGIDRRDPDGIDAERDQVIQPGANSAQVSDAIAVAVLKRARIDLIDDSALPPVVG